MPFCTDNMALIRVKLVEVLLNEGNRKSKWAHISGYKSLRTLDAILFAFIDARHSQPNEKLIKWKQALSLVVYGLLLYT